MFRIIFSFVIIVFLFGCTDLRKVPEGDFIGTWELHGRPMFEGIKISIERESEGELKGRIITKNKNKYVKMFVDSNDVWISEIKRSSNFQFRITEKRVAKELFSQYKLSTSDEFKVEFIDKNTIGLGKGNSDPLKSKIFYKRIE